MRGSLFCGEGVDVLVLVEDDAIQGAFEFPASVEAREHAIDLAGAHFFGGLCPIGGGAEPEGAEVAEFDDVALGEFIEDDGEQGFDGGDHVGGGQRGCKKYGRL